MASEDAKKILILIETAHPEHKARLNEIDARVHAYVHHLEFLRLLHPYRMASSRSYYGRGRKGNERIWRGPAYTRSRDDLKGIRPKGWHSYAAPAGSDCVFPLFQALAQLPSGRAALSPALPTEELAELHAIIQAIDYTRGGV